MSKEEGDDDVQEQERVKSWDDLDFLSLGEEDDFVFNIISCLVKRRAELGMTQRQLAEVSGVKQSAIARLESFRAVPQLDTLYKLLKPLKLKIELVQG